MSQRRQPFLAARRRTLAAFATLPALPIATAMTTTAPDAAHDADAIVAPQPVLDLDRAAMDLFDAAEAGRWRDARDALSRARAATAALRSVEGAYTDAGGALHRYIEARNGLGADLLEAGTAVSVQAGAGWSVSPATSPRGLESSHCRLSVTGTRWHRSSRRCCISRFACAGRWCGRTTSDFTPPWATSRDSGRPCAAGSARGWPPTGCMRSTPHSGG
ncbi:MAG: hypothetical protein KF786_10140 [Burkholderiaceae bacterium]|nr:hypothetical protein [Burkholderiaceae bacterium]